MKMTTAHWTALEVECRAVARGLRHLPELTREDRDDLIADALTHFAGSLTRGATEVPAENIQAYLNRAIATWMMQTAWDAAKARGMLVDADLTALAEPAPDPIDDDVAAVLAACRSDQERRLIELRLEGLHMHAIAQRLSMSRASAYRLLERIAQRVRRSGV